MKIEWLLILSISVALVYISYTDIRWRRIGNNITLMILFFSLILGILSPDGPSLSLPAILLFIGFILSACCVIGAGDVKLMCALAVALPPAGIGDFLLFTGLAGIPLSLFTLLYYRIFARLSQITIPYGVALSSGYWLQLIFSAH